MRTITSVPSDDRVSSICTFFNKRSTKVLTRSVFKSVINSGGVCHLEESASRIVSVALCLILQLENKSLYYMTHYASDGDGGPTFPEDSLVQYFGESGRERYEDTLLYVSTDRNTDDCSYKRATYDDYVTLEPNIIKMSEKFWEGIVYDKYTCFENGRVVCSFILWPNVVKLDSTDRYSLSVFSIVVAEDYTQQSVLDSISKVSKEVYEAGTFCLLKSSGLCLPQHSCAAFSVSKRLDTDIVYLS